MHFSYPEIVLRSS